MKCDKLKAYTLFTTSSLSGQRVYLTNKVDEAIAEIKAKLHDAEMRADLAEAAETEGKIDYDNLKKEHKQTIRALWLCRYGMARLQYMLYRKMNVAKDMLYWFDKQKKFKVKADKFKEDV